MEANTPHQNGLTNGRAAAAILASGFGSLALGLFTCLTQALAPLDVALSFYDPVGSLSGETTLAVVAWFAAWALFHLRWRSKSVNFTKVFTVTLMMIGFGLLGTFPPFFQLFGG